MRTRHGARGGFALIMVVLLLFAVGIAGVTGYQVVQVEWQLANFGEEGSVALDVAHAGLERYMAESYGVPADSVQYVVGDGDVTVTRRKIADLDVDTELYLITATGEVADPRWPESPARRVVNQYARLHKDPFKARAALSTTADTVELQYDGSLQTIVDGDDKTSSSDCAHGGGPNIGAVLNSWKLKTPVGSQWGDVDGNPNQIKIDDTDGGNPAIRDTLGVRFDVLAAPTFNIVDDGTIPPFYSLPADSFPVWRVMTDLTATIYESGRGVLIVPGTLQVSWGFTWRGIILAGNITSMVASSSAAQITGAVAGGFTGEVDNLVVSGTTLQFDPCVVAHANRSIAYFEPLEGTWWETEG